MKKTIIVVSIHVVVQILIYCFLSYLHLGLLVFSIIQPTLPSVAELVYMHSSSVLVSLLIAAIFIAFWRNTWRLNTICVIINLVLIMIYSVFIWMEYHS